MILMSGLGGNCPPDPPGGCPQTSWYDSEFSCRCIPFDAQQAPAQQSGGVPWWQSAITGLTQGAVTGLVQPGQKPPMPGGGFPMPQPKPFYATPIGMIGLGIGALVLIMLLKK